MNLVKVFEVIKDEKKAEEFLKQKGNSFDLRQMSILWKPLESKKKFPKMSTQENGV